MGKCCPYSTCIWRSASPCSCWAWIQPAMSVHLGRAEGCRGFSSTGARAAPASGPTMPTRPWTAVRPGSSPPTDTLSCAGRKAVRRGRPPCPPTRNPLRLGEGLLKVRCPPPLPLPLPHRGFPGGGTARKLKEKLDAEAHGPSREGCKNPPPPRSPAQPGAPSPNFWVGGGGWSFIPAQT